MYAIIESGGKQYRVEKESIVTVDLIHLEAGSEYKTDKILFVKSGENKYQIGTPYITGAEVSGKILSHLKAKKVVIFKKKRRKGYQKKQGHRQNYTQLQITEIKVK
ncbi:MAG: 50S ribosomal protein L21 [Deltaproteobacteria bacterium]|nr:50S ribosomal protein L21 [Deltaproteobacteria bacterium]